MTRFTYFWLHIPSGKRGESTQEFPSLDVFLKFINRCNRQNPGLWQYWTEEYA